MQSPLDIKHLLQYYHDIGINYIVGDQKACYTNDTPSDLLHGTSMKNHTTANNHPLHKKSDTGKSKEQTVATIEASDNSLNNQELSSMLESCPNINTLKQLVENYAKCPLKNNAINTVFSDGDPNCGLMLIGEGPGMHEDEQGKPFVGESGMLLNAMFRTINIPRDKLYITNTVFWRPPGNRKPTPSEINSCLPFLEKHIALVKPRLIVLLGATAVSAVLNLHSSLTPMRLKTHQYTNRYLKGQEIQTIVTYHPSYLLRQPTQKKLSWHDMLFIKLIFEQNNKQLA